MREPSRRDGSPGWYWQARIVLDAVKTGAVVIIRWVWELHLFHRS